MIGAFPDLYPDELLMSGWARYEAWICYAQRRALLEELLGNYKATVAFDLPGRLGYFVASLPPEHPVASIEKLVAEHTLFPFYAAFLPPERRTMICQQMCSDDGVNIHTWLGLSVVRRSLPTTLRYCPLCVDEDRERFGETYWHRIHQVAGASVCPHHAVWLEDSTVAMWIIPGSVTFTTAESAVTPVSPRYLQVEKSSEQQLLRIAHAVQWLLIHPQTSADTFNLKERCLLPLAKQGLASYSGRYQQRKILQAFQSIFPPELLSQIACDFPEYDTGASWLTRLLQKRDTTTFALYCLLLVLFLADDIPSFLALPSEWQPFGVGPWLCLNPACDQDGKLCISKYEFDYNHKGLPRATFTCTVCGFVYSRIGPDTSDDDLYRIGAIKDHGALWHARLLELWFDPDVTIRHMVSVLRSSWTHLRRQGTQLELPFPPPGVRSRRLTTSPIPLETNNNLQRLTAQREAWLTVIQKHPDWSMNSLREHFSQLYSWLRYHDRKWLLQQSPRQERLATT